MTGGITYRHNVIEINSLDTFYSIRGGFNNNIRDVYFVRALGESQDYAEKIYDIDKRMGMEAARGSLKYIRIGKLSNALDDAAVRKYSEIYDQWKAGGRLMLDCIEENALLSQTAGAALAGAENIYKEIKNGISDTIIKNFSIKILFWTEKYMKDCFKGWNERVCVKAAFENIVKDQEYLFGYFLSLLGFDVILLENKSDITISDKAKKYSQAMAIGPFGTTSLKEYTDAGQHALHTADNTQIHQRDCRENIKVVIPARTRKSKHPANTVKPASGELQKESSGKAEGTGTNRQEKSFEELALMASSIVMIAVHDANDEIIGTGSGIMIGSRGYILTNNHVIAGGRVFSVRIEEDDNIYTTDEVIKYNPSMDLAVIRINRELQPMKIYKGSQKLARGQKVVAIGSPLGLFNSVSDGIISGFRNIHDCEMIQFTAPISPGSSGGAVINMYGEVVGISTAGFDNGQNINLAVNYENIRIFARGFMDDV